MRRSIRAAGSAPFLLAVALLAAGPRANAAEHVTVVPRPDGARAVSIALPNNGRLVTADSDGVVRTLDTRTGTVVATYPVPDAIRRCSIVELAPDGNSVAGVRSEPGGAMSAGQVHVLVADLTTGKLLLDAEVAGEKPLELRWTQDGRVAVLTEAGLTTHAPGRKEPTSRVKWPERLRLPDDEPESRIGLQRARQLTAISTEGDAFAVVDPSIYGGRVSIADTQGLVELGREGPALAVEFVTGGRFVMIGDYGQVEFVDRQTRRRRAFQPELFATMDGLRPAASPSGRLVLLAGTRGEIVGAETGGVARRAPHEADQSVRPVWSPDSRRCAYLSSEAAAIVIIDVAGLDAEEAAEAERRLHAETLPQVSDAEGRLLPPGATERLGSTFLQPADGTTAVAWISEQRLLVAGESEPPVVWDLRTRRAVPHGFGVDGERLVAIQRTRDGTRFLISTFNGGTLRRRALLVDGQGKTLHAFEADGGHLEFALADDGARVAGVSDYVCVVWDAKTGAETGRLLAWELDEQDRLSSGVVALPAGSTRVLLGTLSGTILSWSGKSAEAPTPVRTCCETEIRTLAASRDGRAVAWQSVVAAGVVQLNGPASADAPLPSEASSRFSRGPPPDLHWVDGGKLLHREGSALVFRDATTGELVGKPIEVPEVTRVTVSPSGLRFAVEDAQGGVVVHAVADGARIASPAARRGPVRALTIAPDGRTLVVASEEGDAEAWSLGASAEPRPLDLGGAVALSMDFDATGTRLAVAGLKSYPGLAGGYRELTVGSIRVVELDSGRTLWARHMDEFVLQTVFIGADDEIVIGLADADVNASTVTVLSAADGEPSRARDLEGATTGFATVPPGAILTVRDGSLWAVPPRGRANRLVELGEMENAGAVTCTYVPATGLVLVAGAVDGACAVVSIDERAVVATLAGAGRYRELAATPDGRHVVGVLEEGFRVHSLPDGKTVVSWAAQPLPLLALAIHPVDGRMFTGHQDGSVLIWDLDVLLAR